MGIIILFTVVGIIVGLKYTGFPNWENFDFDGFCGILISFLTGLVGFLAGLLICVVLNVIFPVMGKYELTKTYQLESLSDNSSVYGKFFIGSGIIEGKMSYAFYYKENDDFFLDHIDSDLGSIRYIDGNPKLEKYEFVQYPTKLQKFLYSINCGCENQIKYVFYVPKGTVSSTFKLDAK